MNMELSQERLTSLTTHVNSMVGEVFKDHIANQRFFPIKDVDISRVSKIVFNRNKTLEINTTGYIWHYGLRFPIRSKLNTSSTITFIDGCRATILGYSGEPRSTFPYTYTGSIRRDNTLHKITKEPTDMNLYFDTLFTLEVMEYFLVVLFNALHIDSNTMDRKTEELHTFMYEYLSKYTSALEPKPLKKRKSEDPTAEFLNLMTSEAQPPKNPGEIILEITDMYGNNCTLYQWYNYIKDENNKVNKNNRIVMLIRPKAYCFIYTKDGVVVEIYTNATDPSAQLNGDDHVSVYKEGFNNDLGAQFYMEEFPLRKDIDWTAEYVANFLLNSAEEIIEAAYINTNIRILYSQHKCNIKGECINPKCISSTLGWAKRTFASNSGKNTGCCAECSCKHFHCYNQDRFRKLKGKILVPDNVSVEGKSKNGLLQSAIIKVSERRMVKSAAKR